MSQRLGRVTFGVSVLGCETLFVGMGCLPLGLPPNLALGELTFRGRTLFEAIDSLKAFDTGSIDSQVGYAEPRAAVVDHGHSLSQDERRRGCAEFARRYLTFQAISQGYGLSDVSQFTQWLHDQGVFDFLGSVVMRPTIRDLAVAKTDSVL